MCFSVILNFGAYRFMHDSDVHNPKHFISSPHCIYTFMSMYSRLALSKFTQVWKYTQSLNMRKFRKCCKFTPFTIYAWILFKLVIKICSFLTSYRLTSPIDILHTLIQVLHSFGKLPNECTPVGYISLLHGSYFDLSILKKSQSSCMQRIIVHFYI